MIESISNCVATLGTQHFSEHFCALLRRDIDVNQCMIFLKPPGRAVTCLWYVNFENQRLAKLLANAYIEQGFRQDPNLGLLQEVKNAEVTTRYFRELESSLQRGYRRYFFDRPGLSDKISVMTAADDYRYYINLYRGKDKECFHTDRQFHRDRMDRLLATLITRHYQFSRCPAGEGRLALLSDRERQVCLGILQGKKAEAIAADLGLTAATVITYRKRAYAKLGINSRRDLFALCCR